MIMKMIKDILIVKIKIYDGEIETNFRGKETPKQKVAYDCFSLITLDSVIRRNNKYYPQTLFKKCKYRIKMSKTKN